MTMIEVKVLGPGCENCEKLERMTLEALNEIEQAYPGTQMGFEKVTDPLRFHEYGVLATPGLVINNQVVISGRLPTRDQVRGWLVAALE
jgi:hypothetical protein